MHYPRSEISGIVNDLIPAKLYHEGTPESIIEENIVSIISLFCQDENAKFDMDLFKKLSEKYIPTK